MTSALDRVLAADSVTNKQKAAAAKTIANRLTKEIQTVREDMCKLAALANFEILTHANPQVIETTLTQKNSEWVGLLNSDNVCDNGYYKDVKSVLSIFIEGTDKQNTAFKYTLVAIDPAYASIDSWLENNRRNVPQTVVLGIYDDYETLLKNVVTQARAAGYKIKKAPKQTANPK